MKPFSCNSLSYFLSSSNSFTPILYGIFAMGAVPGKSSIRNLMSWLVLGILNANRKIHKRTDQMYLSPGSILEYQFSTGNVSVLIKIQDRPRITI